MATFKNITDGPKGIHDVNGDLHMIEKGASKDVDVLEGDLKAAEGMEWFEIKGGAVKGSAKPAAGDDGANRPEVLYGKSKDQLIALAKAEEVDLPEDATIPVIKELIENKRAEKANETVTSTEGA